MRHRSWIALLVILLLSGHLHLARAQGGPTLPPAARIVGLRHEYQTWCNCGPVNLTMVLSYYGWPYDQQTAAGWLKPTVADKNVAPPEMVAYVQQQTTLPNLRALWRYGGDLDLIKTLIAAQIPVIVESGFQPPESEWMGHYITVVAYDDAVQTIWTFDSYTGIGTGLGEETQYTAFDAWWSHFNRVFVVVYPAEREAEVMQLLGDHADPMAAAARARTDAEAAIIERPAESWGYFNLGTSAAALKEYKIAAAAFDEAFRHDLPFRMLWYQFGPYEAYYFSGRFNDVIRLADTTEAITTDVEETKYWRGLAYAALGSADLALNEFNQALVFNPHFSAAQIARDQIHDGTFSAPAPFVSNAIP